MTPNIGWLLDSVLHAVGAFQMTHIGLAALEFGEGATCLTEWVDFSVTSEFFWLHKIIVDRF